MCKGGERKHLNVALWHGVFLHPWTVSWRQVCPRGSRCPCEATSLSLWCPFSPLPTVPCYLRSPRHMCTSLEQAYSYHCLQEVCSVFPAFKRLNGTFHLLYGNLTNASHLGKREWNWCFPSSPGLMRGWQMSIKLEVEKQQNRSLLSTLSRRPVLESPCVRNFYNTLVLKWNLTPRASVVVSTSIPCPLHNSFETYLTKRSSIILLLWVSDFW